MIDKNFVIQNEKFEKNKDLLDSLFSDNDGNMPEIIFVNEPIDMYDILVQAGIFKSKSDAKKNWKRTGREIPKGFSDFQKIGKLNNRITIWLPI